MIDKFLPGLFKVDISFHRNILVLIGLFRMRSKRNIINQILKVLKKLLKCQKDLILFEIIPSKMRRVYRDEDLMLIYLL